MTTRFAPSTTGEAHPGTLLSALLCWLDARSRGDRVLLRLEDIDPARCKPAFAEAMREHLAWFGLDWDEVSVQSEAGLAHEHALDALQARDLLYPCGCSRKERRQSGRRSPDGGFAYDNTCRSRRLPTGGWRACTEPVRLRLADERISLIDESGLDLSQAPAHDMGDPVVRRRDGAVAYHLAVVVDDAASGVDRIVRGRDIGPSTATHVAIQRRLGLPTPVYRHHFLLLEERDDGRKLSKFHGAVGARELARVYRADQLCGFLAWVAGLRAQPDACRPRELLADFSWDVVVEQDRVIHWRDGQLTAGPS